MNKKFFGKNHNKKKQKEKEKKNHVFKQYKRGKKPM